MNTEDFVTYQQAFSLKRLGFRDKCIAFYDCGRLKGSNIEQVFNVEDIGISCNLSGFKHIVDAPTLEQARKWLRKKNIDIEIPMEPHPDHIRTYGLYAVSTNEDNPFGISGEGYGSYEEALSDGITECLKMLEKNESKSNKDGRNN